MSGACGIARRRARIVILHDALRQSSSTRQHQTSTAPVACQAFFELLASVAHGVWLAVYQMQGMLMCTAARNFSNPCFGAHKHAVHGRYCTACQQQLHAAFFC